ncbi:MAG: hypothetical protein JSC189_000912 [Candidatus Tokpelaia sp. JSC189]|nr:MAG: hypothetical protein JSC189_000912 [Candidatus Tokpelaia sp. JSC189]
MTHRDIIDSWPSLKVFSDDIGVAYGTAKAMRRRGSVPAIYWDTMIAKAASRHIVGVSYKSLAVSIPRPFKRGSTA